MDEGIAQDEKVTYAVIAGWYVVFLIVIGMWWHGRGVQRQSDEGAVSMGWKEEDMAFF